jgi:hypothetical protein
MVRDFISAFCPGVTYELAYDYLNKIKEVAAKRNIYYECSSLPRASQI